MIYKHNHPQILHCICIIAMLYRRAVLKYIPHIAPHNSAIILLSDYKKGLLLLILDFLVVLVATVLPSTAHPPQFFASLSWWGESVTKTSVASRTLPGWSIWKKQQAQEVATESTMSFGIALLE